MPHPDRWTAATYGDGFADVYDEWYSEVTDVEGTVATVLDLGGPVLELGIGTGRLALALLTAGLEVHGVDASRAMVERLRAKPGGADLEVMVADMTLDMPSGPFATVLIAYNTLFNVFEAEAQYRVVSLAASRLTPGGHLVIEAAVPGDGGRYPGSTSSPAPPDRPDRRDEVRVRSVSPGRLVLSAGVFDETDNTAMGQFVDISADGIVMRPWRIRMAGPDEIDDMATLAGLVLVDRHADWRGRQFDPTSAVHISVYRKVTTADFG